MIMIAKTMIVNLLIAKKYDKELAHDICDTELVDNKNHDNEVCHLRCDNQCMGNFASFYSYLSKQSLLLSTDINGLKYV